METIRVVGGYEVSGVIAETLERLRQEIFDEDEGDGTRMSGFHPNWVEVDDGGFLTLRETREELPGKGWQAVVRDAAGEGYAHCGWARRAIWVHPMDAPTDDGGYTNAWTWVGVEAKVAICHYHPTE